jgi:hypothetical protein
MIWSSSLCRSTLEDSSKVYFEFFGVVFHILGILVVCNNFWNYKRKKEIETGVHSAGPHFRPWPSVRPSPAAQAMQPAQPVWCAQCARPHGHRAWCGHSGAAGLGSPGDKVRQGRRCKHQGKLGFASDKEVTAAHLSGAVARRCEGGSSMTASEAVEALQWSSVVARGTCSTTEPRER